MFELRLISCFVHVTQHKKGTPYGDWLMCIQALFTIAICWCGGQRSRDDVHFFSIHDFKKCAATRLGYAAAPIIWVLENGLHKHTRMQNGKLLRRSPYPVIDFALLEGLREWYDILIGGRNSAWDVSYDKANRRPADGARLLLRPTENAKPGDAVYWRLGKMGASCTNFILPVVLILQTIMTGEGPAARPLIAKGGTWSMSSLRHGCSAMMARKGVGEALRSVILGTSP